MNTTALFLKNQEIEQKIVKSLQDLANAPISVLNVLLYASRKYKDIYLSQETIAIRAGINERTVRKVLYTLRAAGLADWMYRGYKQTCLYKVNPLFSLQHIQQMVAGFLSSLRFIPFAMLYLGTSLGLCQPELGRLYKKKIEVVSLSSLPPVYFKSTGECSNTSERKKDSVSRTNKLTFTSTKGEKVMKTLDSLHLSPEQRQELSQFSTAVIQKALLRLNKAQYVTPENYYKYLLGAAKGISSDSPSLGERTVTSSKKAAQARNRVGDIQQAYRDSQAKQAAICAPPVQQSDETVEQYIARLEGLLADQQTHPIQKDYCHKYLAAARNKQRVSFLQGVYQQTPTSEKSADISHPLVEIGSRIQEPDDVFLAKIEAKLKDPTLHPLTRELNEKMAAVLRARINSSLGDLSTGITNTPFPPPPSRAILAAEEPGVALHPYPAPGEPQI